MMTREELIRKYPTLRTGMHVRSGDGEDLGEIIDLGEDFFAIQKGRFFPREFTARYSDIVGVHGNEAVMSTSRAELEPWRSEKFLGWGEYDLKNEPLAEKPVADRETMPPREPGLAPGSSREEVRVPVAEEELDVTKRMQEADKVNARKVVHTELKHLTVPVKKEYVEIEKDKKTPFEPPQRKVG